ncbi:MAG TPA: hypothetical protein VF739_13885 [Ktedonobacterales bacterium]
MRGQARFWHAGGATTSLSANGDKLLSNQSHTANVSLLTFTARKASCVVDVSNFSITRLQT